MTEQYLEFLSLKGGCTGSSESTLVKKLFSVLTVYVIVQFGSCGTMVEEKKLFSTLTVNIIVHFCC